jgi:hypothetical protein
MGMPEIFHDCLYGDRIAAQKADGSRHRLTFRSTYVI